MKIIKGKGTTIKKIFERKNTIKVEQCYEWSDQIQFFLCQIIIS